MYGGTAIALRLGGRQSLDFDFFTDHPVSADALGRSLGFLHGATLLQAEPNTATFAIERDGEIKVSFFGGLTFGRIAAPDRCEDVGVLLASPLDLMAQKLKVILVRAEAKDYLDICTLLKAGIDLAQGLGAARALYPDFNPLISLKALTYFEEPALATVSQEIRQVLTAASAKVNEIPTVVRASQRIAPRQTIQVDSPRGGIRI
jgi:hypothetical protein